MVVITGHAFLLQRDLENLLADLHVVEVGEVLPVYGCQLVAELDLLHRLVEKAVGRFNVIPAVGRQFVHLVIGQPGSDRERQVTDVLHPHVELQRFQAGHSRHVVEVVNLEQVDLPHPTVGWLNQMGEFVLAVDDRHRVIVDRLRITYPAVEDEVQHRIIEPDVVEADHAIISGN